MHWLILWSLSANATPLDDGIEALALKETEMAISAFQACLKSKVIADEIKIECQWEYGWALWLEGDWDGVVHQWCAVKFGGGDHIGLD